MLADKDQLGRDGLMHGRYSAMIVGADGTAWGRLGEATDVPSVTSEESVGRPDDFEAEDEAALAQWLLTHAEELVAAAGPEDQVEVPRSIFGADSRAVVDNTSTLSSYPWRTVGNLLYGSTSYTAGGCTGTKIGPRHVLTAAHCLHNCASSPTWNNTIYFSPGQQGSSTNNGGPRQMVTRYARSCYPIEYDYGLIVTGDSSSFASLGWIGYGWWSPLSNYVNKWAYVRGYPLNTLACADSPLSSGDCGGYMYSHITQLPNVAHENGYIYHISDTDSGHSGSSVINFLGTSPIVMGVHKGGNAPFTGAVISSNPPNMNLAARMRSTMWDDICTWIGNHPSVHAGHPCQ